MMPFWQAWLVSVALVGGIYGALEGAVWLANHNPTALQVLVLFLMTLALAGILMRP